ncbi:MAG: UDP-N-acetylmuramoyl-tripeptide--D-alanyl-D-alanine ligase [Candidatus Omnitrophota bacterium]
MKFTVEEISEITGGKLSSKNKKKLIEEGFSVDSRTIRPGQFFIALKGKNFDGHDYINEAVRKKAMGIIVERVNDKLLKQEIGHIILTQNNFRAMGRIAEEIRRRINIPVICITGTNGKTTVKDILAEVLSSKYKVLRSIKSYNNIVGVSLTLFNLTVDYDMAVVELGTNYPGEIAELSRIAGPDVAVITNIGNGHLQYFSDKKGVLKEKMSLLKYLRENGKGFLNIDDDLLSDVSREKFLIEFFGTKPGSDFYVDKILEKTDGYEFCVNKRKYFIPLKGIHNVYNSAAAISVAEFFGIGYKDIYKSLEKISLPKMRLEKTIAGGRVFINDSYNANPESFEAALRFLESCKAPRKGVVAGDMAELGKESENFHKKIGASIADKNIDFLIVLGKKAVHIANGAGEKGMKKDLIAHVSNHEEAAEMIRMMSCPEAMILLKGSRSSRMEEVLKCYTTSYIH